MGFKFELGQKIFIAENGHAVTVVGRTEFLGGKPPRYCVESETAIPGKNMPQDWINESGLTNIEPAPKEEKQPEEKKQEQLPPGKRHIPVRKMTRVRSNPNG